MMFGLKEEEKNLESDLIVLFVLYCSVMFLLVFNLIQSC